MCRRIWESRQGEEENACHFRKDACRIIGEDVCIFDIILQHKTGTKSVKLFRGTMIKCIIFKPCYEF